MQEGIIGGAHLFPKVCYKEEVKEEKPKFWVWEWLKKKFST